MKAVWKYNKKFFQKKCIFLLKSVIFLAILKDANILLTFIKLMERTNKEKRHALAETFRKQIAMSSERASVIRSLVCKNTYDESDRLRIQILLNKVSLVQGCEDEYRDLIVHLYTDESLREKARSFKRRWLGN